MYLGTMQLNCPLLPMPFDFWSTACLTLQKAKHATVETESFEAVSPDAGSPNLHRSGITLHLHAILG